MTKYKWLALLVSLLVLLASSLPIVYFSLYPKSDLVFLGRRYTNSQDTYTYLSFIEQAKAGHLTFKNLYTSEAQPYSLIRPSYLALGKLAALTGQSSLLAYHLGRVILSILFLFFLWKFIRNFMSSEHDQFLIYLLAITSSGLGGMLYKWIPNSIDLWVPESNTFFMLGEAPHFILSQLLMILGFEAFIIYLKNHRPSSLLISSLVFLALSFEHPFNLVVIIPVLTLVGWWQKISWKKLILVLLAPLLGLGYQYYLTTESPILSAWQLQNSLLTPSPILVFTGYGLLTILGLIGLERLLADDKLSAGQKLLIVWVVVTGIALYLPLNFQRRLIEGVHLPLSILSGYGLLFLSKKLKRSQQNLAHTIILVILAITSVFMTAYDFKMINQDSSDSYYYYLHSGEMKALNWLKEHSQEDDVILSSSYLGNLIPGLIDRPVYLGHRVQTIDWDQKSQNLDNFVRNYSHDYNAQFLSSNHLKYVFLGRGDILLRNGFNPDNYPELKQIYNQAGVLIYQVI